MNFRQRIVLWIFLIVVASLVTIQAHELKAEQSFLTWAELPELPPAPGEQIQPGVAGPFAGISNDALIIAGGANFPKPVWKTTKVYYDHVYVFTKKAQIQGENEYTWIQGFKLDRPIAYGMSVSTEYGLVCMGGMDGKRVFPQVFLLCWEPEAKQINRQYLPNLPEPCAHGYSTIIGNTIYLAGGQSGLGLETAMKNFWSLDISKRPNYDEMKNETLIELTQKRGIILSEDKEKFPVSNRDDKYKNIRTKIIKKLITSDSLAVHFYSLNRKQLLQIASKYALKISSEASRAEILAGLQAAHWGDFIWQKLPSWPGASRALNITVAQHNGEANCVYVISGRRYRTHEDRIIEFLTDIYEFNPTKYDPEYFNQETGRYTGKDRCKTPWRQRQEAPACVMAGTGIDVGQSHIFILGGANGSLMAKANELKDQHPGFPKRALAYHTITDTWIKAGAIPSNHVTTVAVKWNDDIIIPSGEIRPRVRSPKILKAEPVQSTDNFGWLNFTALGVYLFGMVGIGIYFTNKNKNTDDYFRGGQHIPWWAAGCSIFATMLSSITYMSVPGKAYAANWEYILGYPAIIITAAIVVYFVLPFFRQIDATSAYEYLEKRFNKAARLIASALFIFFQIVRMAIVMFLSALALAAITPFTEIECILIMAVLSIIYCTLGGIEAVIWTDTIQTFILMGGAFLIFGLVLCNIDGGIVGFIKTASEANKFHAINWNWNLLSYTTAAFWVLILGSLGQNLVSYTSDQAVVQRYMTTSDQKKAAKSIWTNGFIALPSGLLFFALGTALFVFYKNNPAHLDPTFKADAILPLFVAREIPAGVAGLIVAGIFAAAQSTISTSMNSTATAVVTDFMRPFHMLKTEKAYLNMARLMTILFGVAGTSIAILFASADIKSLLEQFFAVIGLFGGSLGGLFLLGMFTRRANGVGAVIGAIVGAFTLYFVRTYTATHFYLYAFIGVSVTMLVGYFASLIFPKSQSLEGLTVFTMGKSLK